MKYISTRGQSPALSFSEILIMKRFIAFLFAIVMLTIGKPMQSFAQEQDTAKPALPVSDTSKAMPAMPDTARTGTQPVTDTTKTKTKSANVSADQSAEISDRISNKEKKAAKKHWGLLYRIHMIGHKRRERKAYINQGHHEFYLRTKRDRKRISRHHLNPTKPTKSSKKMQRKIQKAFNKSDKDRKQHMKDAEEPAPKEENGKQEPESEKPKENKDVPKNDTEKPKDDTTSHKLFQDIR